MNKNKGTNFQPNHSIEYGLRVTARHLQTHKVVSVGCLFCSSNNGTKEDNSTRDRKRLKTNLHKHWVAPGFIPSNYKSHHELNHGQEWADYQILSSPDKAKYFDEKISRKSTPIVQYFELNKDGLIFYLQKNIVDILFFEVLLNDITDDPITNEKAVGSGFQKGIYTTR